MIKFKIKLSKKHFIGLAAIMVVALGLLGYFVWSNFIQSKSGDQTKNDNSSVNAMSDQYDVKVDLSESTTDTAHGSGLAIKYPKTWKVTNEGYLEWIIKYEGETIEFEPGFVMPTNPDKITITSPDDKVSVIFDIGAWDTPTTCKPDNEMKLKLAKVETSLIPAYKDYIFATSINYSPEYGVYYYNIGAFKGGEWVNTAKIDDPECTIGLQDISFKGTDYDSVAILQVKLNDVKDGMKTTLDDVNYATASDNFNIAKQIVKSLYVKK